MPLAINEDHSALADVVRSFAATHGLRALTRGALEAPGPDIDPVWKQISELGWLGLHLPEEHGGSGFGIPEVAIVAEGLGAQVASGPFLTTVVASAVIAEIGTDEQRRTLLPGLADGSLPASLSLRTNSDGTGIALGGTWAQVHLVAVGDDLAIVSSDAVVTEPVAGLDPSLGLTRLTWPARSDSARDDSARTGATGLLPGGVAVALRLLRTLAAAEAAGGARTCLDMALAYAKVREQFGRTIGGFQAVKHHLADMLVRCELATAAAWDAARTVAGDEADLAAAVAATVALPAYQRNAQVNIQIHGGIGFTWEHDAHLYLRRAVSLAALVGPVEQTADAVHGLIRDGVRRHYAIELPPEAEAFRRDAAAFVGEFRAAAPDDQRALLVDSGYMLPHWQRPWGREAGPVEQLVIEEELAGIAVPRLGIGGWVLLTITQHGSAEQIDRWIRRSLFGELTWCQMFSEPGAGSDAAAVQTRGVRVEGGWLVTGQKVWTTTAQICDRGLATIRTDPEAAKHRGITTMAIDLKAPGVEVRPLREITGDALFNEIFMTDVFVPDADVVGEVNGGWTVARATLGNERVSIGGAAGGGGGLSAIDLVAMHARHTPADAGLAREVGALVAAEQALRLLNLRQVERAVVGAEPSVEGNVTKLVVAEHAQAVSELGIRIAGADAVTGGEPALVSEYLFGRALTIAGGTSEISRNVIGERILGLPREIIPR